jgi:predicted nucleic acid-binding protein
MKVLFDTNVYIAEALLGDAAETMISATEDTAYKNKRRAAARAPKPT